MKILKKYNREMPTEIKLVYDVQSNKLKADYKYDLIHTNDPNKTASSIAKQWLEQIKDENN